MQVNKQLPQSPRWLYIILGIIIMMFLGTVYSYSVFRLSLEQEFQIGSVESGMPYMTALASYAVFMFISGKYLEKYKPTTIILVGGLLVSLGWILSSFTSNIAMLTLTYGCISGAGVGIAYGVPMTAAAKWFPEKKGLAVGLVLVGFGLSPLITAPAARMLVESFGVMRSFLILGVSFAIVLPLLSAPFKYPDSDDTKKLHDNKDNASSTDLTIKEMVRTKSFVGLYINFVIGTMIGLMMIGMTTNIGVELIGLTPSTVTALMAVFAVFNGLGRPTFGWLTDRLTSKRSMLISYALISLSAILLIVFSENIVVYIVSYSVFWFNLGGWLAIAPASTMKLYGLKHYSRNYGLVFTAYGIGAINGVSTSGLLLDYLGSYQYIFYYIIALCLLGVITIFKFIKD